MSLISTLGNKLWLRDNEAAIKKLLPDTWTHIANLNGLQIAFGLKLLGVDWRSDSDFGKIMLFFERAGIMQLQNGYQVRANPSAVFS